MKRLIVIIALFCIKLHAGDIWINANPVAASGSNVTCTYAYTNLVNYQKTAALGWGWVQDTNSTMHTVTDTNSPTTKIEYLSNGGLRGCSSSPLTVPTSNQKFRFTVYNAAPVGQPYWIKLTGFLP